MTNYFKPTVDTDYNQTIVFGVSTSNRKKDFGLVKALGYRFDRDTKLEIVWANVQKINGFPPFVRLKNVQFGYVPIGKSSTDIVWVDDKKRIPVRETQYICYRGVRIRKAEYDTLHRPNQKKWTDVERQVRRNETLQLSLSSLVKKWKDTGIWDQIGTTTKTSEYLSVLSPQEFLSHKSSGPITRVAQSLSDLRGHFVLPMKALAVQLANTYGGLSIQQLFYENQPRYVTE